MQVITVLKPIEGVPVSVSYQGNAVYRVQVGNTLPGVINLMWDESAYVTTRGESDTHIASAGGGKVIARAPGTAGRISDRAGFAAGSGFHGRELARIQP